MAKIMYLPYSVTWVGTRISPHGFPMESVTKGYVDVEVWPELEEWGLEVTMIPEGKE